MKSARDSESSPAFAAVLETGHEYLSYDLFSITIWLDGILTQDSFPWSICKFANLSASLVSIRSGITSCQLCLSLDLYEISPCMGPGRDPPVSSPAPASITTISLSRGGNSHRSIGMNLHREVIRGIVMTVHTAHTKKSDIRK